MLRNRQRQLRVHSEFRDELLHISEANIDPLSINLCEPVHVTHDVAWKPDLFEPCRPLVNIRNMWYELRTVRRHDLGEVGQVHVIDFVLAWRAVPRPVDITGSSQRYLLLKF